MKKNLYQERAEWLLAQKYSSHERGKSMPLMLPCQIYGTSVVAGSFRGVYVSPYNNQEYKRYKSPNYDVHWWEPLKNIPEFYESEVFEDYVVFHEVVGTKLGYNHEAFFKHSPFILTKIKFVLL